MNTSTPNLAAAMFWKESKENILWAALFLSGVLIILFYSISESIPKGQSLNVELRIVWNLAAASVVTVCAPVCALALGFAQILPERRRDHWAFLIHRPASSERLFWGKVTAGLCLYFASLIAPLIIIAIWLAMPGSYHLPFRLYLFTTPIFVILTSVLFYFAGILTVIGSARWYGSRAISIPAALLCDMIILSIKSGAWAFLICLCFLTLFALAACGSFVTSGRFKDQNRPAKLGTMTVCYLGIFATTLAFVLLLVLSYWSSSRPQVNDFASLSSYEISKKGTIAKVTIVNDHYQNITDLQGHPILGGLLGSIVGPVEFLTLPNNILPQYENSWTPVSISTSAMPGIASSTDFTFITKDRTQNWYYIGAARKFTVCSLATGQVLGYLGPRGWAAISEPDAFEKAGRFDDYFLGYYHLRKNSLLLHFRQSVYRLDTQKLTLKTIPGLDRLKQIQQIDFVRSAFQPDLPPVLAVETRSDYYAFTMDGRLLLQSAQIRKSIHSPSEVLMTPDTHKFYLWHDSGIHGQSAPAATITEITPNAKITKTYILPAFSPIQYRTSQFDWALVSGVAAPPALLFVHEFSRLHHLNRNYDPISWLLSNQGVSSRIFYSLSLIFGLVSSVLAWLIGRRCAFHTRPQWIWTVAIFCLGLPGVLLMLSLYEWPAQAACAKCGSKRVVTRERCEHCETGWPSPPPDATEIFESAAEVRMVSSGSASLAS